MALGKNYVDRRHSCVEGECAYESVKLSGDDLQTGYEECFKMAADELGTKDIKMVNWFWSPDWLGTVWRRRTQ